MFLAINILIGQKWFKNLKMVYMKQKLNLDTWSRKEHFLFFKQMEEPFFGVTITIDCTKAYDKAASLGVSFFNFYI